MKESTVYLLYNTNASNIRLHRGPVTDLNGTIKKIEWEYEDKDEFTIMYSPDDERKYTDFKILSKTKLKERPKSADQLMTKPKVSVEGILIRRATSFSSIEDLLVVQRCPQIKPLLSEREILELQVLLGECRRRNQEEKRREHNEKDGLNQVSPDVMSDGQVTDYKDTHMYKTIKEMGDKKNLSFSPKEQELNYRDREKKQSNDNKGVKTRTNNSPSKRETTAKSSIKKLKINGDSKKVTKTAANSPSLKNTDNIGTRSKSGAKSKHGGKEVILLEGNKKVNKKKPLETLAKPEQKSQEKAKKSVISTQDEYNKTKSKKINEKSVKKTKPELPSSKETLTSKDHLEYLTESKQKEDSNDSRPMLNTKDDKKSNKNKPKHTTDDKRHSSITHKSAPLVETRNKPIEKSEKQVKSENKAKLSVLSSGKVNLRKIKEEREQNYPEDEMNLPESSVKKTNDGKSTQAKSSPATKSKITHEHEDLENENALSKKGKNKLLPNQVQYMIHYILSNPIFIDLGWTILPPEKSLLRIVTFKAEPANPLSYCFRSRDNVEQKYYPSGVLAVNIAENGTGRINYPCGTPAAILSRNRAGMKLTLYSRPTRNPLIKDSFYSTIVGMFDSFGNGVIYNSDRRNILNFNQMEGKYNNSVKKILYKWQWSCYKILEAQRIKELLNAIVSEVKEAAPISKGKKIMAIPSSNSSRKSLPVISVENKPADKVYEAILAELPKPEIPKSNLSIKTHKIAFKSIILKINNEITLRINGQDNVIVNFCAGKIFYKLDLGVMIDPKVVERVDEVAEDRVDGVSNLLTDLLHPSSSFKNLHELLDPDSIH